MTKFQDYSEWLTPERLANEERQWIESENIEFLAILVQSLIDDFKLKSIVEFGCATGHVAKRIELSENGNYKGFDKNPDCIKCALLRNESMPNREFEIGDVRDCHLSIDHEHDLVIAHAFFKHFSLEEIDQVFDDVLSCGRYAVFSLPISASESFDDGVEFHHSWIDQSRLNSMLESSCHEELFIPEFWPRKSLPERRVFVTRRNC